VPETNSINVGREFLIVGFERRRRTGTSIFDSIKLTCGKDGRGIVNNGRVDGDGVDTIGGDKPGVVHIESEEIGVGFGIFFDLNRDIVGTVAFGIGGKRFFEVEEVLARFVVEGRGVKSIGLSLGVSIGGVETKVEDVGRNLFLKNDLFFKTSGESGVVNINIGSNVGKGDSVAFTNGSNELALDVGESKSNFVTTGERVLNHWFVGVSFTDLH